MQLFSSVIGQLTRVGYRYDDTGKNADFVVYIAGYTSSYETTYVPPETATIPRWVPDQTITSTADASIYYGGQYGYGNATQQTRIPGHMTTDTYTTSGYTTGNFYPSISLAFHDAGTGKQIYYGQAVWTSDIPDIRVAFPWVSNFAFRDFPRASSPASCDVPSGRTLGVGTITGTLDGNNYFPLVANFSEDHPARYLNGEELQRYDAIMSVNGQSLRNTTDSCQQMTIITQPQNKSAVRKLQVLRGHEVVEVLVELY